jgi:hypothetical protein
MEKASDMRWCAALCLLLTGCNDVSRSGVGGGGGVFDTPEKGVVACDFSVQYQWFRKGGRTRAVVSGPIVLGVAPPGVDPWWGGAVTEASLGKLGSQAGKFEIGGVYLMDSPTTWRRIGSMNAPLTVEVDAEVGPLAIGGLVISRLFRDEGAEFATVLSEELKK